MMTTNNCFEKNPNAGGQGREDAVNSCIDTLTHAILV